MVARQGHGFKLETFLEKKFDALELSDDYTSAQDGGFTLFGYEVDCSIKNTRNGGEMCLGDFERIVQCDKPLLLFAGGYSSRRITDRIRVLFLPDGFRPLFGSHIDEVESFVREFKDYMRGHMSDCDEYAFDPQIFEFNERANDAAWKKDRKTFLQRYDKIFEHDDVLIHPRPKRDHKSQRRLQCAIPYRYLEQFYADFEIAEISASSFDDPLAWNWAESEIRAGLDGVGALPCDLPDYRYPLYGLAMLDDRGDAIEAIYSICWDSPEEAEDIAMDDPRCIVVALDVSPDYDYICYSFVGANHHTAAYFLGSDNSLLDGMFATAADARDEIAYQLSPDGRYMEGHLDVCGVRFLDDAEDCW